MTTALLIIVFLLLLALTVCICAMLIYTHNRIDRLVNIINKNASIGNYKFEQIFKNGKIMQKSIDEMRNKHNGLVLQLAENEALEGGCSNCPKYDGK